MKKLIALLAILSTGFVSCEKNDDCSPAASEKLTVENAVVVAAGDVLSQKSSTGLAKLYQQKNGAYTLGLEAMNLNAGTSLVVYLSGSKTVSDASIKIFSAPLLYGNMLHRLPQGLDPKFYRYVLVQTEPAEELVASAELK